MDRTFYNSILGGLSSIIIGICWAHIILHNKKKDYFKNQILYVVRSEFISENEIYAKLSVNGEKKVGEQMVAICLEEMRRDGILEYANHGGKHSYRIPQGKTGQSPSRDKQTSRGNCREEVA